MLKSGGRAKLGSSFIMHFFFPILYLVLHVISLFLYPCVLIVSLSFQSYIHIPHHPTSLPISRCGLCELFIAALCSFYNLTNSIRHFTVLG